MTATYDPALCERILRDAKARRPHRAWPFPPTRSELNEAEDAITALADQLEAAGAEIARIAQALRYERAESVAAWAIANATDITRHEQAFVDIAAERDALRAKVERREPVIQAAQNWAIARCPDAGSCGDGYTYHSNRCPTETTQAALMKAVDAYRTAPTAAGPSWQSSNPIVAALESASLEPACPGPDCPMCSGAMCNLCGAGCWNNSAPRCDHATDERHQDSPTAAGKEE